MVININDIQIPSYMTKPNDSKYMKRLLKYQNTGELKGKIKLDTEGYLVDGYIKYLILLNEKPGCMIDVVVDHTSYKNKETTYVYGTHLNSPDTKTYVWRMPVGEEYIPCIGELLLVKTKYGIAPITVNKVEVTNKCPVDSYVKLVKKWGMQNAVQVQRI